MAVPVRPKAGPINSYLVAAFLCGAITWWSWPQKGDWWQWGVVWFFYMAATAVCVAGAVGGLVRDYRLRRALTLSELLSDDHGSARQATRVEIAARKMDDASHGDLLGLMDDGTPVWAPANTPFGLYEAPPGVGKTVCWVIGSILHRAMRGYSLIVPDVKAELAYILAPFLRTLGFEVWVINPASMYLNKVGNIELNPYQSAIDAVFSDGLARKDAVKYAADYAAIHNPIKGDEKNPYFVHGSRRATFTALLSSAVIDPTRCTPTDIYQLMADPAKFLKRMSTIVKRLETHIPNDPIVETLKSEALNLLHRSEKNEENFASFLEGATQKLLPFNPAGHLGGYGREAVHNLAHIRKRQIIVFVQTPLSHLREFETFTSLLNHDVIAVCKADPAGHPVHIVGEEALSYLLPELASDLETMRQLRVSGDFYIQSYAGLVKKYGRESAASIESYCDVRVYAGVNSYDRAKNLSDMLAEETLRKQDFSYQSEMTGMNISSRELGRRLATADEILAMPRDRAWVFVRGMRPMCLRMVHYGQAFPWCDWVGDSPISGTRLPSNPTITIHCPQRGMA